MNEERLVAVFCKGCQSFHAFGHIFKRPNEEDEFVCEMCFNSKFTISDENLEDIDGQEDAQGFRPNPQSGDDFEEGGEEKR
jgi:hypothetical protein